MGTRGEVGLILHSPQRRTPRDAVAEVYWDDAIGGYGARALYDLAGETLIDAYPGRIYTVKQWDALFARGLVDDKYSTDQPSIASDGTIDENSYVIDPTIGKGKIDPIFKGNPVPYLNEPSKGKKKHGVPDQKVNCYWVLNMTYKQPMIEIYTLPLKGKKTVVKRGDPLLLCYGTKYHGRNYTTSCPRTPIKRHYLYPTGPPRSVEPRYSFSQGQWIERPRGKRELQGSSRMPSFPYHMSSRNDSSSSSPSLQSTVSINSIPTTVTQSSVLNSATSVPTTVAHSSANSPQRRPLAQFFVSLFNDAFRHMHPSCQADTRVFMEMLHKADDAYMQGRVDATIYGSLLSMMLKIKDPTITMVSALTEMKTMKLPDELQGASSRIKQLDTNMLHAHVDLLTDSKGWNGLCYQPTSPPRTLYGYVFTPLHAYALEHTDERCQVTSDIVNIFDRADTLFREGRSATVYAAAVAIAIKIQYPDATVDDVAARVRSLGAVLVNKPEFPADLTLAMRQLTSAALRDTLRRLTPIKWSELCPGHRPARPQKHRTG